MPVIPATRKAEAGESREPGVGQCFDGILKCQCCIEQLKTEVYGLSDDLKGKAQKNPFMDFFYAFLLFCGTNSINIVEQDSCIGRNIVGLGCDTTRLPR